MLTLNRADETSIVIRMSDILANTNAREMTGTFRNQDVDIILCNYLSIASDAAAASKITRPEKS